MFKFFPKTKREWLHAFVFPFQAFVVIGYFAHYYFFSSLPFNYRGELMNLNFDMLLGYAICFFALLFAGVGQMFKSQRLAGLLNIGLAILAVWFAHSLQFVFP
jgi:hypothetical protein